MSRGERQKIVTDSYRKGWKRIYKTVEPMTATDLLKREKDARSLPNPILDYLINQTLKKIVIRQFPQGAPYKLG